MILSPVVAMPHRNTSVRDIGATRKRRAPNVARANEPEWQSSSRSNAQQSGKKSSSGNRVHQQAKEASTSAIPIPAEAISRSHRRASTQSLTLDLDGLDLGLHGPSPKSAEPGMPRSMLSERSPVWRTSPSLTHHHHHLFHQQHDKEIGPSLLQLPEAMPFSQAKARCTNAGQMDEDSFAMHLRHCEDAHDIPSVETVLQSPSAFVGAMRHVSDLPPAPRIVDGNEHVLGGFASLGIVKSPREASTFLRSESEGTSPISPSQSQEFASPWTTLKMEPRDASYVEEIATIDEMGLHSINCGDADGWRGTALKSLQDSPVSPSSPTKPSAPVRWAEWAIARSVNRQRKWVVTPADPIAARTVVVSDHITKRSDSFDSSPIEQHPSAFSGQASFSLRFLQAGNGAPDCSIVLATAAAHRARIEEQRQAASASTTTLGSVGLDQEQMRGFNDGTSSILNEPSLALRLDDAWPALRGRTLNAAKESAASEGFERKLTHSKSTSTIVAQNIVHIESRRPSLGKSISHDGLAADASPRPADGFSVNNEAGASTDAFEESSLQEDRSNYVKPKSIYAQRLSLSVGHRTSSGAEFRLPSESVSPFGDYAIGLEPKVLDSSTDGKQRSPKKRLADLHNGPSPRSSLQNERPDEATASTYTHMRNLSGQPILSTIDPGRFASLQGLSMLKVPNGSAKLAPLQTGQLSPSANLSQKGSALGRREKSLGEWLRRKVKPVNAVTSSALPSPQISSPPLPPAWEPLSSMSASVVGLGASRPIAAGLDWDPPCTGKKGSKSSSADSESTLSTSARPALQAVKSESSHFSSSTVAIRDQRRRSNSDDVLASMRGIDRNRLASSGFADIVAASTPQSPLSNPPSQPFQMSFGDANTFSPANNSTSLIGHPSSDAPSLLGSKLPFRHQLHRTRMTPIELRELGDVPADAMTMILALPMSDQADMSFASRYLRVSFVPFRDAPSFSNETDDSLSGSGCGGNGDSDENVDREASPSSLAPALSSPSTWYKRLARPFHGAPLYEDVPSWNRSPPPGLIDPTQQPNARSKMTTTATKRDSFRIIAKVLANQEDDMHALGGMSTVPASTSLLPEPLSFPVILGMCDSSGRLDLIPEGWQSIGLRDGPINSDLAAPAALTRHSQESANPSTAFPHPLSGVADLIIAGCAACMNL